MGLRVGVVATIATVILGFITAGLEKGVIWVGTLGLILFAIAAIFSGLLTSGDRLRANYSDAEDFVTSMTPIMTKYCVFNRGISSGQVICSNKDILLELDKHEECSPSNSEPHEYIRKQLPKVWGLFIPRLDCP